jgi:ribosomal protein S18 acetylase RimI-like enzyme
MKILDLHNALILLGMNKFLTDIKYMSEVTYNLWYDKYYKYNLDKYPDWTCLYNLFMSIANHTNDSSYYNCYVYIQNDNIVGFISLNYNDFNIFVEDLDNINSLWLTDLFVWPEYRNKGISSRLIDHVINIAVKLDTKLYLACDNSLINYYKKYGFSIIDINDSKYNILNQNWNFMTK